MRLKMKAQNIEEKQPKDMSVKKDTELKEWLVDYVGNKLSPKNKEVTVEMIVDVFIEEFPEFMLVLAEENYMRGYQQGMDDVVHLLSKNKDETKAS